MANTTKAPVNDEFVLPPAPRVGFDRTLALLGELWGPLVIYASLTMLSGFASAFMSPSADSEVNLPIYNLASLGGVLFLALLAFLSNRVFDLKKTFRAAFPGIALLLAMLPFADHSYSLLFHGALSFLGSIVNVSMLFLLIETARVRQAPPIAAVAGCMLVARVALFASLAAGTAMGSRLDMDETMQTMVLVVTGIYLLSMTLMLLTHHRGSLDRDANHDVSVPLTSDQLNFNLPGKPNRPACSKTDESPEDSRAGEAGILASAPSGLDGLAATASRLAKDYRLTQREQEVVLMLAQGRSAPYIAEQLGLTTNTVRGYVQEAYAKLDVHSKQELINLFTQ